MSRSIRRARRDRAIKRNLRTRDIIALRSSPMEDTRVATDEGRALIGHGRPRSRKARSDEARMDWGFKPIQPRRAAIAEQVA